MPDKLRLVREQNVGSIYSNSQNLARLSWSPGKTCFIIWRWYAQKPSLCKILHTHVRDVPSSWRFCLYFLPCTVARTSPSLRICCPRSAFAHGREPVSFTVLRTVSNVLRCGLQIFQTSSPTICSTETEHGMHVGVFFVVKLFGIVISPPYCNTTQPLATTVHKQYLDQRAALLAHSNTPNLMMSTNNYGLLQIFCSRWPVEHDPEVCSLRRETLYYVHVHVCSYA
jgi:hypothetical protein